MALTVYKADNGVWLVTGTISTPFEAELFLHQFTEYTKPRIDAGGWDLTHFPVSMDIGDWAHGVMPSLRPTTVSTEFDLFGQFVSWAADATTP